MIPSDCGVGEVSRPDAVPPSRGRDLDDPAEIAEMVRRFYADVAQDHLLGPLFTEVARVGWSEHLPKLTAFWCRALLSMPGYEGNPLRAHLTVHAREPFTPAHFERWLELFHETLDGRWSGPKVARAKALAERVATVHSNRLNGEPVVWAPVDGPERPDGRRRDFLARSRVLELAVGPVTEEPP